MFFKAIFGFVPNRMGCTGLKPVVWGHAEGWELIELSRALLACHKGNSSFICFILLLPNRLFFSFCKKHSKLGCFLELELSALSISFL